MRIDTTNLPHGYVVLLPRKITNRHRLDPHSMLVAKCCLCFSLPHSEGQTLATLMEQELVSRKELHAAISSLETDPKIIDVVVCKLRRKIRPYGIEIATVRKQGFCLTPNNQVKVRRLLAEISQTGAPSTGTSKKIKLPIARGAPGARDWSAPGGQGDGSKPHNQSTQHRVHRSWENGNGGVARQNAYRAEKWREILPNLQTKKVDIERGRAQS
jgi:Transcriptional regulatory protein, C terminal